jgi:hypothetical protein
MPGVVSKPRKIGPAGKGDPDNRPWASQAARPRLVKGLNALGWGHGGIEDIKAARL